MQLQNVASVTWKRVARYKIKKFLRYNCIISLLNSLRVLNGQQRRTKIKLELSMFKHMVREYDISEQKCTRYTVAIGESLSSVM